MIVHLHVGVGWKLVELGFSLTRIHCLPLRLIRTVELLCLVKLVLGRRRVADNHSRYGTFSRWRFYVVYVSDRICSFM
jgi:hypothetical protein